MLLLLRRPRHRPPVQSRKSPNGLRFFLAPYILFNLSLAVGLRDLVARVLAHKRIREVAFLLLVLCAGLPQLLIIRGPVGDQGIRALFGDSWTGWPWTATANLIEQKSIQQSLAILGAWALAAAVFGYWQFRTSLVVRCTSGFRQRIPSAREGGMDREILPLFPRSFFAIPLPH